MDLSDKISRYSYLWTTEFPDWVLVKMQVDAVSVFLIENSKTNEVLLVSDPELKQALSEEMLKRGCRVIGGEDETVREK